MLKFSVSSLAISSGLTSIISGLLLTNVSVVNAQVNLIQNGSFENGFTGWDALGNLEVLTGDFGFSSPSDGFSNVSFNGGNLEPNAVLFQTFSTVPGSSYILSFDFAKGESLFNPEPGDAVLGIDIEGNSLLESTAVGDTFATIPFTPDQYVNFQLPFTADSTNTTLSFSDFSGGLINPGALNFDALLDNIIVSTEIIDNDDSIVDPLTDSDNFGISSVGSFSNPTVIVQSGLLGEVERRLTLNVTQLLNNFADVDIPAVDDPFQPGLTISNGDTVKSDLDIEYLLSEPVDFTRNNTDGLRFNILGSDFGGDITTTINGEEQTVSYPALVETATFVDLPFSLFQTDLTSVTTFKLNIDVPGGSVNGAGDLRLAFIGTTKSESTSVPEPQSILGILAFASVNLLIRHGKKARD